MHRSCLLALLATSARVSGASGGLYGLSASLAVSQVWPNGSITPLGPDYASSWVAYEGLTALDESSALLYVMAENASDAGSGPGNIAYVGFALQTGQQVSAVPLPFPENVYVGLGQATAWIPPTGLDSASASGSSSAAASPGRFVAMGTAQPYPNETHMIGFIDPTSGQWDQIVAFKSPYSVTDGGATAYCPTEGLLLFELGDGANFSIYSLDLATGKLVQHAQDYSGGHDLQTMDYDPATDRIYGLGLVQDGSRAWIRTVAALDCSSVASARETAQDGALGYAIGKALNITVIGTVSAYTVSLGGLAGLDVDSKVLYWPGQVTNATDPASAPFYLVANSIEDGRIVNVSEQPLCTMSAQDRAALDVSRPGVADRAPDRDTRHAVAVTRRTTAAVRAGTWPTSVTAADQGCPWALDYLNSQ